MQLPGAFWTALILALIPVVSSVLSQFFPDSQYWWSALIVAALAAAAKAVQVRQGGETPPAEPGATARGAAPSTERSKTRRWLLG